jgi:hypothetical protein
MYLEPHMAQKHLDKREKLGLITSFFALIARTVKGNTAFDVEALFNKTFAASVFNKGMRMTDDW